MPQRNMNEKRFFSTSPWNGLAKTRVGVPALKKFLAKLLYNHIKEEFPALVQEIREKVQQCREDLSAFGPSRETTVQQRQYLSRLCSKYQHTVADSLRGNYDSTWEKSDIRKLRMHIHSKNESFAARLARKGYTKAFRKTDDNADQDFEDKVEDEESIYDWIRQIYLESRGAELPGTVNPKVLENLFRQQAKEWRPIAEAHLSKIDDIVSAFNEKVLRSIFVEEDMYHKMERRNKAYACSARQQAEEQLQSLVADEMARLLELLSGSKCDHVLRTVASSQSPMAGTAEY